MKKNLLYFSYCIIVFVFCYSSLIAQQDQKPYKEEEVRFKAGNVTLAGTLTIPKLPGQYPVVILISGAGVDNRDAEVSGFKPFRIMADHLSRHGIAVLRCDDRGVGESTGKHILQSTIEDLADDVFAAIKLLKSRNDINPIQIGLIGHSLGGLISAYVAARSADVAFIIPLAGPVTKTDEMNLKYRKTLLTRQGKTQKEIDKAVEVEKRMVEVTRTGIGYKDLLEDMKAIEESNFEKLNEDQKKRYNSFDEYYQSTWYGLLSSYINTPLMRSFYNYKPVPHLEKVTCPALFLFGERDDQVPIQDSGDLIINALNKAGNYDYTLRIIPKADHYFVRDWSKKEFTPGFLNILSNWILERVDIVK